ncbi:XPA-interacting protein [Strigomonas culicis]|uniref:GPN-loop GTPase n=1 Tax=Strigomonas culicis TaxID=28005 RepID=S9TYN6_9TRYP|nr:XPA-interacting protein [Strigomonas culicis]EPY23721.1 XPA-interacting protein [Strigomonas culicis]|eukprot:EPY21773.1 XPA-interacting protein [Strigomonas culicis]
MASSSADGAPAVNASAVASPAAKKPVVLLIIGMAGTGKTTLVHRLQHHAAQQRKSMYFVNLDPAVLHVPYNVNIDIRDTVNYKEVMQQYQLGPNGAILTSLNLFATKFHQVVSLLEKKDNVDWIVIDTPGQIEVFTWSASGQLMTEALRAALPTVALFVADTTRCMNPHTFVSTMLYSSGIMLKQQVPLVVVFNKVDVVTADVVVSWMRDEDKWETALAGESAEGGGGHAADALAVGGGGGYATTLAQSLALFLHEYYEDLPFACVSAASGAGMDQLEAAVAAARVTAEVEMQQAQAHAQEVRTARQHQQLQALVRDGAGDEEAGRS